HYEEGWQWVSDYYDNFIDGQYVQAHAVEVYFQLPIGNDYVINGYIDRLQKNPDGSYEILDYKTDPKLRTQKEVDNDLQLTSYYWAMKQLGIDVSSLSLEFLKFSKRVTTKRTSEDIPAFTSEVNKVVGEMASKQAEIEKYPHKGEKLFPPKVNKYCGGCDFLIGCPKEKEIRTVYKDEVMNLEEEPVEEPEVKDKEESEEEKDKG
ncbi:RecB family exonuclease, partial [Elusimicrobiota bacterium]